MDETRDETLAETEAEAPATEETTETEGVAVEETDPVEETPVVEETTVEEAPAEAEAEDGEKRDPATPVAAGEELSAEEIRERANHVVANPEERTAHDPVPADGQPV